MRAGRFESMLVEMITSSYQVVGRLSVGDQGDNER